MRLTLHRDKQFTEVLTLGSPCTMLTFQSGEVVLLGNGLVLMLGAHPDAETVEIDFDVDTLPPHRSIDV